MTAPGARRARAPGHPSRWKALLVPVVAVAASAALLSLGIGLADVVLIYQGKSQVTGTGSPFRFANGANYAAASAEGLVTNTYPNAQQASVTATVRGASGAYGTYLLDVLEIRANATSAATWHLRVDTTTALVATGVNAAYVFVCTTAPTGVPDTGAPVVSGTDANGNPWALFKPNCAGTEYGIPLTALAAGTTVNFVGIIAAATLLYLSFALAVTNTGAATTTPATLTLVASTP